MNGLWLGGLVFILSVKKVPEYTEILFRLNLYLSDQVLVSQVIIRLTLIKQSIVNLRPRLW